MRALDGRLDGTSRRAHERARRRGAGCACALLAPRAAHAQDPRAATVQRVARDWLALVDKLDAEASWKAAGARFQQSTPPEAWVETLRARTRAARGAGAARRRQRRLSARRAPGCPTAAAMRSCDSGRRSRTRATSVEEVTLEVGPDYAWRVIGYSDSVTASARVDRERRAIEVRLSRMRRRGHVEPGERPSSCARSAAPSPPPSWTRRRDRRARSPRRTARSAGRCRRGGDGEAPSQVPELQRDLGARSVPPGPELRILRLRAARALRRDDARASPGKRAAVHAQRDRSARSHSRVVSEAVARAVGAREKGADRHGARRLPAVLDFRRAGRRGVDRRGRPLLLHDGNVRAGTDACKRGRCGMCAGSRPRAGCSTFSTTTWSARRWACTPGCCAGSSPFRRRS